MKPQRIQLTRKRGFNLQDESRRSNGLAAVKVDRTTIFGNPWIPGSPAFVMMGKEKVQIGPALTVHGAVARYRAWLEGEFGQDAGAKDHRTFGFVMVPPGRQPIIDALPTLRGKNIACWCDLCDPCHGLPLLQIANR